ncbi:hypothetical protein AHAS_Ahas16G0153000 [Arachis hypogaea]
MHAAVDAIRLLSPWRVNWRIKVKVVSLWIPLNVDAEGKERILQMVLMDENVIIQNFYRSTIFFICMDKIQATIKNDLTEKFSDQVKEGDVYIISNFRVIPNVGRLKITKHRFQLSFCDYIDRDVIISHMMNKKFVFMIDARPIGYELDMSLHVVRATCDDNCIINFFEDATNVNNQKLLLETNVPHMPLEMGDGIQFHSLSSNDGDSSSTIYDGSHENIGLSHSTIIPTYDNELTIQQQLRIAFGRDSNADDTTE